VQYTLSCDGRWQVDNIIVAGKRRCLFFTEDDEEVQRYAEDNRAALYAVVNLKPKCSRYYTVEVEAITRPTDARTQSIARPL